MKNASRIVRPPGTAETKKIKIGNATKDGVYKIIQSVETWCAGARCERWVDAINVKAQVNRSLQSGEKQKNVISAEIPQ